MGGLQMFIKKFIENLNVDNLCYKRDQEEFMLKMIEYVR